MWSNSRAALFLGSLRTRAWIQTGPDVAAALPSPQYPRLFAALIIVNGRAHVAAFPRFVSPALLPRTGATCWPSCLAPLQPRASLQPTAVHQALSALLLSPPSRLQVTGLSLRLLALLSSNLPAPYAWSRSRTAQPSRHLGAQFLSASSFPRRQASCPTPLSPLPPSLQPPAPVGGSRRSRRRRPRASRPVPHSGRSSHRAGRARCPPGRQASPRSISSGAGTRPILLLRSPRRGAGAHPGPLSE